jgi:NTP pyrophosphatase (non-canonical NTP hydrolase)
MTVEYVTKTELVEILYEIADAISSNNSNLLRHLAWRLEKGIFEADLAKEEDKPNE